MKYLLSALLLAMLGACGGGSTSDPTTSAIDPVDTTTSTNTPQSVDTTSADGATTTTASGRQRAPDFTLELGDGGSYTLSEGAKPVYLVFWAEW